MIKTARQAILATALMGTTAFTALNYSPYREAMDAASEQNQKMEMMWDDLTVNDPKYAEAKNTLDTRRIFEDENGKHVLHEKDAAGMYNKIENPASKEYKEYYNAIEMKQGAEEAIKPEIDKLSELEQKTVLPTVKLIGGAMLTLGLFAMNVASVVGSGRKRRDDEPQPEQNRKQSFSM